MAAVVFPDWWTPYMRAMFPEGPTECVQFIHETDQSYTARRRRPDCPHAGQCWLRIERFNAPVRPLSRAHPVGQR